MIIIRLNGGLGNQLFQFATGRALSLRLQAPLVIDDRVFHSDGFRRFSLGVFRCRFQLPSDVPNVQRCLPPPRKRWLAFSKWRLIHGRRFAYLRETSLTFDPKILKAGCNSYLHGYWQSEKYFADMAPQIREELTIAPEPTSENRELLSRIAAQTAVSLHVRRGDYVSDPKASKIHGTCSLRYYENAARHIAERLSETPTFYLFSDDPSWVEENLRLPFPTHCVRQAHDAKDYEDLRLMAACDHHIVANSSFSWWGAWLGQNTKKIVIAPKVWFSDPSRSDRTIVPDAWVRL